MLGTTEPRETTKTEADSLSGSVQPLVRRTHLYSGFGKFLNLSEKQLTEL